MSEEKKEEKKNVTLTVQSAKHVLPTKFQLEKLAELLKKEKEDNGKSNS